MNKAQGNYCHEDDIGNWPVAISSTVNFITTDVDLINDKITVGIDLVTGSLIKFTSTGTLPVPLVYGTAYYAIRVDATHIKVATTPITAASGTAIDLTSVGIGTHTMNVGEGSTTTARQETIDRAEKLVEKITRDVFYSKAFVTTIDGNNKDRLFLGMWAKILTVTKVETGGVEIPIDYITHDDDSIYLDPEVAIDGDLVELHYQMKQREILFPEGTKNIKATGTCGTASCPAGIKKAVIMLCEAENDITLYQRYGPTEQTEAIDGYSVIRKRYISGVVEVDRVLMPFLTRRPTFGAV